VSWVKLDDAFPSHPKALAAGPEACWLYVVALCHAKHHLTDGCVSRAVVLSLLRRPERQVLALAARLVAARLWEAEGEDYRIHNYAERNLTRAEVESERSAWRERQQRRRAPDMSRRDIRVTPPAVTGGQVRDLACAGVRGGARPRPHPGSETETETETEKKISAPPVPVGPSVADLEARYPDGLAAEARAACALSRRSGRLADSLWLTVLAKLATYPVEAVAASVRTFVDLHADGQKDERYLLGIVRGAIKPRVDPRKTPTHPEPRPPSHTLWKEPTP
jgi:hypothetical protein